MGKTATISDKFASSMQQLSRAGAELAIDKAAEPVLSAVLLLT
jgi:hypothetical protein